MLPLEHVSAVGNHRREMEGDRTMLHFITLGSLREPKISVCVQLHACIYMCIEL